MTRTPGKTVHRDAPAPATSAARTCPPPHSATRAASADRIARAPDTPTPARFPTGAASPLRYRVRGFSLLPAVPPGASVEVTAPGLRRPVPGDLVVVELAGVPTCHVVESVGPAPHGPLVTRGLWARDPDPPVPAAALAGFVTAVVLGGLRVPATGIPFRAWLAAGRTAAPFLRFVRALAWARVPSSLKEPLRRGIARREP